MDQFFINKERNNSKQVFIRHEKPYSQRTKNENDQK